MHGHGPRPRLSQRGSGEPSPPSAAPSARNSFSTGAQLHINAFRAAARGVALGVPKPKAGAEEEPKKKKKLTARHAPLSFPSFRLVVRLGTASLWSLRARTPPRRQVPELKERLAREKGEREKAEARAHVLAFSGREAHRHHTFTEDGEGEPPMDEQEARTEIPPRCPGARDDDRPQDRPLDSPPPRALPRKPHRSLRSRRRWRC